MSNESSQCYGNEVGGTIQPCSPRIPSLHMYLDTNRDGQVDYDSPAPNLWQWGHGETKGAIILCNNDADNETRTIDNQNEVIDGEDDLDDLAQLAIRKTPEELAFPNEWTAYLSTSDRTKIRIFKQNGANWDLVIGPHDGAFTIEDLNSEPEMMFRMEATQYPDLTFDGLITLYLEVRDERMVRRSAQRTKVRVAPWIMANHLNQTEDIYIIQRHDNSHFIRALTEQATRDSIDDSPNIHLIPGQAYLDTNANEPRWIQDVMEIGFSSLPKDQEHSLWHLPVVVPTPNNLDSNLDRYPIRELLGRNFGYHELQSSTALDQIEDIEISFMPGGMDPNSLGNLECSPPVTVNGREYLFGRIIFGSHELLRPIHPRVREFLESQEIQAPFAVDTSWLAVGHIDEIFSFCPWENTPRGFKIIMPGPQRALEILESLPADTPLFQGVNTGEGSPETVDIILNNRSLRNANDRAESLIEAIEQHLRTNLGFGNHEDAVIKLPVLFRYYDQPDERDPDGPPLPTSLLTAYTSNTVNMLVVTKPDGTANLCIPKPFGPIQAGQCLFEEDIINQLTSSGNTFLPFIDCFEVYHNNLGEIHCATNSRRKPPTNKWWWQQLI